MFYLISKNEIKLFVYFFQSISLYLNLRVEYASFRNVNKYYRIQLFGNKVVCDSID